MTTLLRLTSPLEPSLLPHRGEAGRQVGEDHYVDESPLSLRRLLSQQDSYPIIAANMASGQLPHFPVALFGHVGDVYRRVETAADHDFDQIEELRLAALVHEEPQESLPTLLG